jgi:WD40 repeat protein
MNAVDEILVEPAAGRLSAAVAAAVATINRHQTDRGEPLRCEPGVASLVEELRARPEGSRAWRVQAQGWRFSTQAELLAVWWSDHVGRRHVRLVGGCSHLGVALPAPSPTRPPLACVYPGPCVFVDHHFRGRLLVVCDCGAWGEPAQVGWMGRQCGPCFDRSESEPALGSAVLDCRGAVFSLAFSADGARLASWDAAGDVVVWDVGRGGAVRAWPGQGGLGRVRFGPGGVVGWWSDREGRTELRDPEDDWEGRLAGWPFDFAGAGAVVYERGPEARLVRHAGLRPASLALPRPRPRAFRLHFALEPHDLALSPDGGLLAAACGGQGLLTWDARDGEPRELVQLGRLPGPLAFSPDGSVLAVLVAGASPWVALWDVPGRRLRSQVAMRDGVAGFAFTPDGRYLVAFAQGDALVVHDVASSLERRVLHLAPGARVRSLALSPCGRLLALGMETGEVRLWPADVLRPEG